MRKKITVQRTAPYGHHEGADANICGALRACPKTKAPARSRPAWNYEMHGTVSFCVLSMEIKRSKILWDRAVPVTCAAIYISAALCVCSRGLYACGRSDRKIGQHAAIQGNENRVQAEGGLDGAGLFQYALVGAFVFPVHISFSSFVIYKNSPCTPSLHSSLFPNSALRIPNSSLSLPLSLL